MAPQFRDTRWPIIPEIVFLFLHLASLIAFVIVMDIHPGGIHDVVYICSIVLSAISVFFTLLYIILLLISRTRNRVNPGATSCLYGCLLVFWVVMLRVFYYWYNDVATLPDEVCPGGSGKGAGYWTSFWGVSTWNEDYENCLDYPLTKGCIGAMGAIIATSLILIAFGVVFSVRERTAVRIQRSRIRMQRPPQLETGFAELEVETPAPPYGPPAPPYSPPLVVTKIGTGYFGSRREV